MGYLDLRLAKSLMRARDQEMENWVQPQRSPRRTGTLHQGRLSQQAARLTRLTGHQLVAWGERLIWASRTLAR